MPRALIIILSCGLLLTASVARAIPGATDRVLANTLLVPYFEADVDPAGDHDTLLVVTNPGADRIVALRVWDRDGHVVDGLNVNILAGKSLSQSVRALIQGFDHNLQDLLQVGTVWRGFITIDAVSSNTELNPFDAAYPLANVNVLEGWIYYTRLGEGSANGLTMVPLEYVGVSHANDPNDNLHGFYKPSDGIEEIDADARVCADTSARGISPCGFDADRLLHAIRLRHFGHAALNGKSRFVIFTWDSTDHRSFGPSKYCDTNGCAKTYKFEQHAESGGILGSSFLRLDHVVNVIDDSEVTSGYVNLYNLPEQTDNWQVYAFSINSASPAGHPEIAFDALFEAHITP